MVVTRRTPAPPASASRTPSTQPLPRLAKKVNQDTLNVPGKPSPLVNGSTHDAPSKPEDVGTASKSAKSKGKTKAKKNGKKKSGRDSLSFTELLFRGLLLWFTIYTLSVCPEDEHLKSPVCRGLAEYRRLVIEPYIIPPIQQALAHPSLAPYIEKTKPYADYAVKTAKPIAVRAHKEFDARVVPQWNKRIVPLYYKYAAPQLLKLNAQTAPYRTRVEQEYERVLAPYVRRTVATLNHFQRQARPYVVLAAEKTRQGYEFARPYARPVWEKVKAVLAQLAAILGEQRRQFVDPHVKKIWEHVKELSNGKPQSPSASKLRSSASSKVSKASSQISKASGKVSSTLSSVASSVASRSSAISSSVVSKDQPASSSISEAASSSAAQVTEVTRSSAAVAADKASSVVSSVSDALKSTAPSAATSASPSVSSVVSVASDAVSSSASSLASAASSVEHAPLESVSSIAEAAPSVASSAAESVTAAALSAVSEAASTVSSETSSALADQVTPAASSANLISSAADVTVTQALGEVPEVADSLPSIVASSQGQDPELLDILSDPDLDLFKAELGLTEDFLEGEESNDAVTQEEETEAEREEEERLRREKNAIDRANVVGRHTEWERKVEALIEESKETLRKSLVEVRNAALAELKDNVEVKTEVDGLVEDAEKFLRGAEKYLANLQKEDRKSEEKRNVWERVVSKLDQKFSERLRQTEGVVNGWYQGILEREAAEVHKLTEKVKDLAERGQADIGLDYAYLDDVTYQDWQRYHDLIRRSENFTVYAQNVQAGSHETSPTNPLIPAIQELQDEVEDVIRGFNARLRQVKRNGARSFGTPDAAVDEPEDGPASILPIDKPEHTETRAEDAAANIPPVAIGRGKEEVEAALNRVADLEGSASGEAEANRDADTVAQSLVEAAASQETSATAPLHEEL